MVLVRKGVNLDADIAPLLSVLTETSLETPVLRAVGSDSDIQRILDTLPVAMRQNPGLAVQLGARALSERRYGDAAEHFARAEIIPTPPHVLRLRILALCLAGELDQARELVLGRHDQIGNFSSVAPFWRSMDERYAIFPVDVASHRD
jgi:hypothetical protein